MRNPCISRRAARGWATPSSRPNSIGGTWDLFRYPGVRSDSDMFTLGYAFAPWRHDRSIVGGDAIIDYLGEVIDSHGIGEHIRFGQTVVAADWDSRAGLWTARLEDEAGNVTTPATRFLFVASGYYDYDAPHDAQLPGLHNFGGLTIHPQFWPDDIDYYGKKVVVIGSGATAATLVPALADRAAHVTMLQRTPSWYLTRPSRDAVAAWLRRLLPAKAAYALTRLRNVRMQNYLFSKSRSAPGAVKGYLRKQLEEQLGSSYEPIHFTPPYGPWEQRLCLIPDGDLFAAIRSGKAQIVTARIERFDETGIALQDGHHLDADIVVTATGLKLNLLGDVGFEVDGRRVELSKAMAYKGAMLSGVPNLAVLFGYTDASWTLNADLACEYVCRCSTRAAARLRGRGAAPRPGARARSPSSTSPRATSSARCTCSPSRGRSGLGSSGRTMPWTCSRFASAPSRTASSSSPGATASPEPPAARSGAAGRPAS